MAHVHHPFPLTNHQSLSVFFWNPAFFCHVYCLGGGGGGGGEVWGGTILSEVSMETEAAAAEEADGSARQPPQWTAL